MLTLGDKTTLKKNGVNFQEEEKVSRDKNNILEDRK